MARSFPFATYRFFLCLLTGLLLCVAPVRAQDQPALPTPVAPALQADEQTINEILALLDGATITQLQAKVKLEGFKLGRGTVELRGLKLEKFDLALRLKPKAARRLFQIAERHLPEAQKPPGLFDILKFGVFRDIELGIHFDELSVGYLKAAATELDVQGLLLNAGINGPPPESIKGRDSRTALLTILKRAVQRQIEVHAGLEKLSARQINANVQKVALLGFRVGLSLRREREEDQ